MSVLAHKDVGGITFTLRKDGKPEPTLTLKVQAVGLYVFDIPIALLVVKVQHDADLLVPLVTLFAPYRVRLGRV